MLPNWWKFMTAFGLIKRVFTYSPNAFQKASSHIVLDYSSFRIRFSKSHFLCIVYVCVSLYQVPERQFYYGPQSERHLNAPSFVWFYELVFFCFFFRSFPFFCFFDSHVRYPPSLYHSHIRMVGNRNPEWFIKTVFSIQYSVGRRYVDVCLPWAWYRGFWTIYLIAKYSLLLAMQNDIDAEDSLSNL